MKSILLLSLPATVGIISWMLSWAFVFAFPPNSYHPYAHDMQMTFNRIFALMTYVGPAAAIFAVVAVYRSSCTRPKRVAFYLRSEERRVGKECRSRWCAAWLSAKE